MKLSRRELAKKAAILIAGLPFVKQAKDAPRLALGESRPRPRRYHVPPTLWHENELGDRWIPPQNGNPYDGYPEGFDYSFSQFPCDLVQTMYDSAGRVGSSTTGWDEHLVLAMAHNGYKLREAILIAATMCERCINGALYEYGLPCSYPRESAHFVNCRTRCEFCETPEERRARYTEERWAPGKVDAEFVDSYSHLVAGTYSYSLPSPYDDRMQISNLGRPTEIEFTPDPQAFPITRDWGGRRA